jgi:hypothetical protein
VSLGEHVATAKHLNVPVGETSGKRLQISFTNSAFVVYYRKKIMKHGGV